MGNVDDVIDAMTELWKEGKISPEQVLSRQYSRIQQLRDEVSRITEERDRQYDENVRRIAEQAKAEREAAKWEWVARKYETLNYTHSWMPTVEDLLTEYTELPPAGFDDLFTEEEKAPTSLLEYYKAQAEEAEFQLSEAIKRETELRRELDVTLTAISVLRGAIVLTREYVGEEMLPEVVGWAWYDAMKATDSFKEP